MNKIIMKFAPLFLFLLTNCQDQGQNQTKTVADRADRYNLDFEVIDGNVPKGWQANGNEEYKFSLDSTIVKNGKKSASIEFKEGAQQFGIWGLIIRENFEGKRITLSGYVKTENVEGYASLLLRIDPEIAVNEIKIEGTNEWKKYQVSVKMDPKKTRNLAIAAMLVGKGKVWFDDLKISIDGKDINTLEPIELIEENNSKINIDQLNDSQIEDLYTLGLVWGFLKYYHPNVAKGKFNWDYELFKTISKILNATENKNLRDDILVEWINSLGKFAENRKEMTIKKEIKLKPDLEWIERSGFSNELVSLLLKVKNSRRTGKNHYAGYHIATNPDFKNEDSYSNILYPDAGFRLLALYRYWNIIQYYFPYKNLIKEDWKDVLIEFIPKIVNTNNETDYALTILELIGRIHDSHATLNFNASIAGYFGIYYAPVKVQFIEGLPVVTGFYNEKSGKESEMEIGDILTKVNNVSIAEFLDKNLKYKPGSNYPAQLRDIARDLLRTNDSIIRIEFIRNNELFYKELKIFSTNEIDIYDLNHERDTSFKMINNGIAYINHHTLQRNQLSEIWKEVKNTKGIIIDIRKPPSDFLVINNLARYLLPEKSNFFIFSTTKHYSIPGLFTMEKHNVIGKKNKDYYKGKVVILVNEETQSTSEFHTMAYQTHPNAVVVGSATAGADGDVSKFFLPGGIYTAISGIGIYYPDGRETQRTGIVPDIEVKPTIQGIKDGRDEVLEKAIEIISVYPQI